MFTRENLKKIPLVSGVYLFKNKKGEVIYVGKALNLRERISSYFSRQPSLKNHYLTCETTDFSFIPVTNEVEALILEANLVKRYKPRFNINLKDDKSFLYIGITDEEFPRVLAFRKNQKDVSFKQSFGPFPSARNVRLVLRILRTIFPYCTQSPESKKPCFYWHLKLCNPCPANIRKEKGETYSSMKKIYLENILRIQKFLSGEMNSLIISLKRQMGTYSLKTEYEEAEKIKKQILALEYIRKPYYKISSFLENPNFLLEENTTALKELFRLLKPYFNNLNFPERIEGIDISNTAGIFPTGSLVVFINGQKSPALYRYFKIKSKGPDDVLMIKEVIKRRQKHKEWDGPDLFIVDGGKNQVSAAREIESLTPLIGLAKSSEKIIVPQANGRFIEINLKKNARALRLIQEIRDEAHRFANKYHQILRKKALQEKAFS